MLRLTRTLLRRGERIFTLSYHSPSLEPGNTPYVRDHRDLAVFLDRISGFLSYFRDELGGVFLTVKELHDQLRAGALADANPEPPLARPPVEGTNRCLVVANTFPPIHGGSAIVYDSLARFGHGRVSVLAPQEDYRDGWPIQGWREFDRRAPFKVHRIRLLRTLFLPEDAGALATHRRAGGGSGDPSVGAAQYRADRPHREDRRAVHRRTGGGRLAGRGVPAPVRAENRDLHPRRGDQHAHPLRRGRPAAAAGIRGGGRDRRGQPVHAGHA